MCFISTLLIQKFNFSRFPSWIFYYNGYDYYGLPSHGNSYSKIGVDAGGPSVTVNTRTYDPDPKREKMCEDVFKQFIPKVTTLQQTDGHFYE